MFYIVSPHKNKIKNNSSCPCGSEKKHKHCCKTVFTPVSCSIKARKPLSWLKQVVDGIDISEDFGDGPRHANSQYPVWSPFYTGKPNEQIIAHITELAAAKRERRQAKSCLDTTWDKQTIEDHCANDRTLFFSGASYWKQRYTLVLIDVDCKRYGTPEGARLFLEFLRNNFFPGLYMEVSTHGNGGHGFLLVDKWHDLDNTIINDVLLHRFAPWLNRMCRGFDVEFTEIKGTLPIVEFTRDGVKYTAGCPAKVPRGLIENFNQIRNTCCISITDLMLLPLVQEEKATKTNTLTVVPPAAGSMGSSVTPEMLDGLKSGGCYHTIAAELFAQKGVDRLRTAKRELVTVDDLAIFLMLTEFCTLNPHENGGLPTARIQKLWTKLRNSGQVDRAFVGSRLRVMRDFVSDLGLIHWIDETYEVGFWEADTYIKGVCMKWSLGEEIMQKMSDVRSAHARKQDEHVDSSLSCNGARQPLWRHILQDIHDWVHDLQFCSPDDQIRPVPILRMVQRHITPDQATAVTGYFETAA